jgi:two-component system chemotaxis sensor kinase CheA
VLVLNDALVPLVELGSSLEITGRADESGATNIVLVSGGGYRYGLIVEKLHDTIEIVVKPLGQRLKHLRQYAGATILGDGCVALILDVAGVASAATLQPEERTPVSEEAAASAAESQHLLLVHNSQEELSALPLHAVGRVEKIQPRQVEFIGGRRSMQYRGRSLPLVALSDLARVSELPLDDNLIVVVLEVVGRSFGLLAARPVDVTEAQIEIDGSTLRQPGVMGSSILRGRTTLILDPFELAKSVLPESESLGAGPRASSSGSGAAILFAEDSNFFREHTTKLLEEEGYRVIAAADGEEAWNLLQKHAPEIRMVLTDVEMPRLDGLQLTRRIRADKTVAHLPVVMLTSLAGEDDMRRGEAAGATGYCVKLDREQVFACIRDALEREAVEEHSDLAALSRQVGENKAGAPEKGE